MSEASGVYVTFVANGLLVDPLGRFLRSAMDNGGIQSLQCLTCIGYCNSLLDLIIHHVVGCGSIPMPTLGRFLR